MIFMDAFQAMGTSAAANVYKLILRDIFNKKYSAGQRLPEIAVAKEYNVSRTPVREALRRLESEGLVKICPGWGACLASPTMQEVIDTYELRVELEVIAIKRAVKNIKPVQICILEENMEEERKVFADRNLERYLAVNVRFHTIIAESSGSETILYYIENILARSNVQSIFLESFFDFDTNPSLYEHEEIVQALAARDQTECERLMRKHIGNSRDALKLKL